MRKTTRRFSQIGPEERLADAITQLPPAAKRALRDVADREDLPLVAGSWDSGGAGCLVANVVRTSDADAAGDDRTLDLRVLDLFPEMSSRDLNGLIVAWDEAALQEGRNTDLVLRRLLRGALARADVHAEGEVTVDDVQAARPAAQAEPLDAPDAAATTGGAQIPA